MQFYFYFWYNKLHFTLALSYMLTLSIILSFMLNQHYILNISNGSAKTVIKIYVYIGNPRMCKTGSIYNYKDTKYL